MEEERRSITREAVNELPIRRYEGEVRLVSGTQELERALEDLHGEAVVGFDTETRPAFRKGESFPPSLAQLATARAVYLFQLRAQDFSGPLAGVLASPAIVKAGVSVADDLKQLKKVFPFEEQAVVDVGLAAKRRGLQQSGVRNLAALFLGFRIPKGAKTTNWATPRLSPQQIQYAATDAWACRELYLKFKALGFL
ncbi:MAG TPA: 3'-5' exonuclease [Burkholderiales bacterium]